MGNSATASRFARQVSWFGNAGRSRLPAAGVRNPLNGAAAGRGSLQPRLKPPAHGRSKARKAPQVAPRGLLLKSVCFGLRVDASATQTQSHQTEAQKRERARLWHHDVRREAGGTNGAGTCTFGGPIASAGEATYVCSKVRVGIPAELRLRKFAMTEFRTVKVRGSPYPLPDNPFEQFVAQ